MESPAMARSSALDEMRYVFSAKGITSSTTSFGNVTPGSDTGAGAASPNVADGPGRPYGITTIIGFALPSAMRLSRIRFACPVVTQPASASPAPCSRYIAGYLAVDTSYPGGVYTHNMRGASNFFET